MERPGIPGTIASAAPGGIGTALRVVACALLVWLFLSGSSMLSLRWPGVLAMAIVASLLAAYELTRREAPPGWVLGSTLLIPACIVGGYLAWRAAQPPAPTGPLLAADEPSPPPGCDEVPETGDLLMAFGTDRVIGKGPGPFAPLLVDDCVVLNLSRKGAGLMVQAFGYDWNNDIAFRVMNNIYEPALLVQLRAFRPDRSTFVLLDRFDKEVLYVRYLNPGAVRIRGRFLCGTAPQAVIQDDVIQVGGVRIGGAFLGQRPTKGHVCATIKAGVHGIAIKGR